MPLSEQEGFAAMFRFLDDYWERNGRPDDVGALLGALALDEDGAPMDPAMWFDWTAAVQAVKSA
jgi:hypothetical protein